MTWTVDMKDRFEAIANPSCRFDIWDNESGEPVVHRGRLLSFATTETAERIAGFLNETAAAGDAEPAPEVPDQAPARTRRATKRHYSGSGSVMTEPSDFAGTGKS
ncbi:MULTISPECIES: hypothetical protein [unclassified Mesorhizobium]|uniref:hypothetical protein n=1 Tax=unclassified Mesorhizobium TaxID=325217 RepID=UPI00333555C0